MDPLPLTFDRILRIVCVAALSSRFFSRKNYSPRRASSGIRSPRVDGGNKPPLVSRPRIVEMGTPGLEGGGNHPRESSQPRSANETGGLATEASRVASLISHQRFLGTVTLNCRHFCAANCLANFFPLFSRSSEGRTRNT